MTLLNDSQPTMLYDPDPPRRRRVPLSLTVGVALVLLLLTATGLWVVGHQSSRTQSPTASPPAQPFQAARSPAGPTSVPAAVGASRLVAGVPVGYQNSEGGAVAAATSYLVAQSDPQMYIADRRHAVVRAIAAPGSADDLIAQVDPGIRLAAQGFGVDSTGKAADGLLVSRVMPIGWRVDSYRPDAARVEVWYGTLAGVAGLHSQAPVTTQFATDSVDLTWAGGDWKWLGLVHSDGPAPVGGVQPPASADQIALAATAFQPYAYGGSR